MFHQKRLSWLDYIALDNFLLNGEHWRAEQLIDSSGHAYQLCLCRILKQGLAQSLIRDGREKRKHTLDMSSNLLNSSDIAHALSVKNYSDIILHIKMQYHMHFLFYASVAKTQTAISVDFS